MLSLDSVKSPVVIESLELLRHGKDSLVLARSREGVEAITVPHPAMMAKAFPVVLDTVFPGFGVTIDPDFVREARVVAR